MDTLPIELLRIIFKSLDGKTLCTLSQVSKEFGVVSNSDIWVLCHGFTKTRSKVIITDLREKVRQAELMNQPVRTNEYRDAFYRDTVSDLSIAYRMLRIPLSLRFVCATLWNRYQLYPVYHRVSQHDPEIEKVRHERDVAEYNVMLWEASFRMPKEKPISYNLSVGYCCASSPWAIS